VADRGSRAAAKGEGRGIEELVAFRMQSAYGSKEPGSCIGEKDAVKKCKVTHIFFIRPSRLARVPAKRERERARRGRCGRGSLSLSLSLSLFSA